MLCSNSLHLHKSFYSIVLFVMLNMCLQDALGDPRRLYLLATFLR